MLHANANVVSNTYIGSLHIPINATYAKIFIVSTVFVLKLYTIAGIVNPSNPNTNVPIITWHIAINTIDITKTIITAINLASNILTLLYGLTSNNFIVPLLNSSLTIEPAITIPIININSSYWLNKFKKISLLFESSERLFSI